MCKNLERWFAPLIVSGIKDCKLGLRMKAKTMTTKRDKLVALGPDQLADALLELAGLHDEADQSVEKLTATPKEKVKRFKTKLTGLKDARRFVDWREIGGFARKLEGMLADLEESLPDGKTGVELVARFFKCDQAVFERCDDSSGLVGDIFRYNATKLFARFAAGCPDKIWLGKLIIDLLDGNEYGARDNLLNSADVFLAEDDMYKLADRFWRLGKDEKDEFRRRRWYGAVEVLADHLGDGPLFEKARLAAWGEPGTAACLDIADVYLKSGEPQTALAWVMRDKNPGTFQEDKRNQLLQTIYKELDEPEKVIEIAWKRFRICRTVNSLEELLTVIGQGQKESVISEQALEIMAEKTFSTINTEFLMTTGCIDQAGEYLLQSVDQLNGDFYYSLLPLAQAMEKANRNLAATMLYRTLLDSILRRARTTTYSHGIRYLKKLDTLAKAISDWQVFSTHEIYKKEIRLAHGRKHSFWGKYDKSDGC